MKQTIDIQDYEYLINSHMRRMRAFCHSALDAEDFMQVGRMAIARAWQSFDETRGVKFSTYANYWVKQHMYQLSAEMGFPVRYPTESFRRLVKANGRVPFGSSLDFTPDDYSESRKERLPAHEQVTQDEEMRLAAMARAANDVCSGILTEREFSIVRLVASGETLTEAGRRHGISRERARQLYDRSMQRLRESPRLAELAEYLEAS
jgi:RNA polymerase primary sigma factor